MGALENTVCASITSVQSTRAPYLDILVVGEDDCVELYRDSNNEDVLVCRLAVLHSDEGQAIDTDDQANAGVNRSAIVKCTGKVWGSIGNLVNVDVSEDAKRLTLIHI